MTEARKLHRRKDRQHDRARIFRGERADRWRPTAGRDRQAAGEARSRSQGARHRHRRGACEGRYRQATCRMGQQARSQRHRARARQCRSALPAAKLIGFSMTDPEGLPYRPCVGVMLLNSAGRVFVGKRADRSEEGVDSTLVSSYEPVGTDGTKAWSGVYGFLRPSLTPLP